jgi:hypothetical protein
LIWKRPRGGNEHSEGGQRVFPIRGGIKIRRKQLNKPPAYYEIKEQVAIVTIDHPPMNALDVTTKEAVGEVFTELDRVRRHTSRILTAE